MQELDVGTSYTRVWSARLDSKSGRLISTTNCEIERGILGLDRSQTKGKRWKITELYSRKQLLTSQVHMQRDELRMYNAMGFADKAHASTAFIIAPMSKLFWDLLYHNIILNNQVSHSSTYYNSFKCTDYSHCICAWAKKSSALFAPVFTSFLAFSPICCFKGTRPNPIFLGSSSCWK